MKIDELTDKCNNVCVNLKVIYDKMPEKQFMGRRSKTVVVVDVDKESGGTTALLDLFDNDVDVYKVQTKLKVINGYAKQITTSRGKQFLITYGFIDGKLIGRYEKIDG